MNRLDGITTAGSHDFQIVLTVDDTSHFWLRSCSWLKQVRTAWLPNEPRCFFRLFINVWATLADVLFNSFTVDLIGGHRYCSTVRFPRDRRMPECCSSYSPLRRDDSRYTIKYGTRQRNRTDAPQKRLTPSANRRTVSARSAVNVAPA